MRCVGLYPYTLGHQKQKVSFCSKSTNAQKADWTAENITMGHTYCRSSASVLGRGTQALPTQALRCPIAVNLALTRGGQWGIFILRNDHFAPLPPPEAGIQVPNTCAVWPQHCSRYLLLLGTGTHQIHTLPPHPGSSAPLQRDRRKMNEPWRKCLFPPAKEPFPAANLSVSFYFPSWADPMQVQHSGILLILYTHVHSSTALFVPATEVTNYTACLTWQLFTRKLYCLYVFAAVNKLS